MRYQQPQVGPVVIDPRVAADFAWNAPTGVSIGPAIASTTAGRKTTTSGIAFSNGYAVVGGKIPSLYGTVWTECGVVLLDNSSDTHILSARTDGQAIVFKPSSSTIDVVMWNVADVNVSNGALPVGIVHYVVRRNGASHSIWLNGKLYGTASASNTPGAYSGISAAIGAQAGSGTYVGGGSLNSAIGILSVVRTPLALPDARCVSLSSNHWQLFKSLNLVLPASISGGITGTLASTEGADTVSASGSVLIGGTLTQTEGADTIIASGSVLVSGTLSATESADSLSASGTVGNAISGTLAVTEGSDTVSASGSVLVSGTLALTEGADTLAATGAVIAGAITGTLSVTEGADTLAATNIVAQPGGGGGGGNVREVRAYAKQFDKLHKPTKAQKKRRRLELIEEALELLPDTDAAEQAAPVIASIVFNREASAIDRYGKAITFDAETALRAQVAAWIQQRAQEDAAEDAEEEEIALQLLLMG